MSEQTISYMQVISPDDPSQKTEAQRWAEYEVCKRRGHSPTNVSGYLYVSNTPNPTPLRQRCKHCGCVYWEETILREENVPMEDL